jgi:hypothetical protein
MNMTPKFNNTAYPSSLEYLMKDPTAIVKAKDHCTKSLRFIEVWGLAFFNWLKEENKKPVYELVYEVGAIKENKPEEEAFRRRISFLKLVNTFKISVQGRPDFRYYNLEELFNRPANEIITDRFEERAGKDHPGRLEKDFQVFLFGGTLLDEKEDVDYSLIYRRLGLLGMDFYKLDKHYKLTREVPTGVFNGEKKAANRILPTYFIDIVAFNKYKELAIIELKLNDPKLEVISQALDYALFAVGYKERFVNTLKKHLGDSYCPKEFEKKPFSCYIVNNHFHPLFDKIAPFYAPKKEYGFNMKKVVLGEMREIN